MHSYVPLYRQMVQQLVLCFLAVLLDEKNDFMSHIAKVRFFLLSPFSACCYIGIVFHKLEDAMQQACTNIVVSLFSISESFVCMCFPSSGHVHSSRRMCMERSRLTSSSPLSDGMSRLSHNPPNRHPFGGSGCKGRHGAKRFSLTVWRWYGRRREFSSRREDRSRFKRSFADELRSAVYACRVPSIWTLFGGIFRHYRKYCWNDASMLSLNAEYCSELWL